MQDKKNNLKKVIYTGICLIGLLAGYWLLMGPDQTRGTIELTQDLPSVSVNATTDSRNKAQINPIIKSNVSPQTSPNVIAKLKLLAVVEAYPAKNSLAVIQYESLSDNYKIGDFISSTDVVLEAVLANYVTVALDGKQYQLNLVGGKVESYSDNDNSVNNKTLNTMTAKEIGNRPKQLEHIILISPENNDYYVKPGLNPALFKSANFKPGDELQSINGKDVTVPEELAAANALITTAQTLEFVVFRDGQTVTLYLDIPSKHLSIN